MYSLAVGGASLRGVGKVPALHLCLCLLYLYPCLYLCYALAYAFV